MSTETSFEVPLWQPGKPSTGPVTASRYRRNAIVYAVLAIAGMLPTLMHGSAAWQAAGLGLWLPGAGFLAVGGWTMLLFPVTVVLFAASVLVWFWCGMVPAPIAVWLGSAALAGALAHEAIWAPAPFLVPMLAALALAYRRHSMVARHAADAGRMKMHEPILPQSMVEVAERTRAEPVAGERELSADDLAALRIIYDAALQPIGQYKGYEMIDQFQPAALRYAINHNGFTLGLVQANYAPSFHGYLQQAQRNLIDTYRERKVWGYWVYESMWGHFNFTNWDPVGKDNIMLTGWYGAHVGQYMLNSGDRRYEEPGSLTFKLNERTQYRHDIHTIIQNVVANFKRSDYCLYPCEPNWLYPICNMYGMTSLIAHDAVFGTRYANEILPEWIRQLDTEMTTDTGSIVPLRSYWTGIEFPFYGGEAAFAGFSNIIMQKRAQRMWAIARTEMGFCITKDDEGKPRVTLPEMHGISRIDPGNYRPGKIPAYAGIIMCAHEFGDNELADAAQRSLDQDCGPVRKDGKLYYRNGSRSANFSAVQGRIVRTGDFRRLFTQGPPKSILTGPFLSEASYPEVQVAKAFSRGSDLELVLYSGAGDGPQKIGIERLKPGAAYVIQGSEAGSLTADANGCASLTVNLRGRTALHIVPA